MLKGFDFLRSFVNECLMDLPRGSLLELKQTKELKIFQLLCLEVM